MSYHENIKKLAKENDDFRRVLHTGKYAQLVLMSIPPGSEIGEETHDTVDQVLFFVKGEGEAILDDQSKPVEKGHAVFVPAGTKHNFKNTGDEDLKLYTLYSPPNHPDGTVHKTLAEAQEHEYH
jgi:mannose-6-phosphate isomerase-like protein (cupin superfamily)